MNWKEFTASVVQSLAWPAITLILAIILRGTIVDLVLRIKRIKHKDTELEFEAKVKEIESKISVAPVIKQSPPSPLLDLASVSPRAAIMEAWIGLEALLYKKAVDLDRLKLNKHQVPLTAIITILEDLKIIDLKTSRSILEMRNLRNQVAHTEDLNIAPEVANRYIELAKEFTEKLKEE